MRKQKKNYKTIVWTLFIAFIMITSIIGFVATDTVNKQRYNGLILQQVGTSWVTEINDKKVNFDYFPTQVEDINISDDIEKRLLNTKMFYITYMPNDTFSQEIAVVQYNLNNILSSNLNIFVSNAFAVNTSYNVPIVTCANSTSYVPVVYFMSSNETSLELEGNCIVAKAASKFDVNRIKDRILYTLFGVME